MTRTSLQEIIPPMSNTIGVRRIWPIADKTCMYVYLEPYNWDFTKGNVVEMFSPASTARFKQAGLLMHEGVACLILDPEGEWKDAIATVDKMVEAHEEIRLRKPGSN